MLFWLSDFSPENKCVNTLVALNIQMLSLKLASNACKFTYVQVCHQSEIMKTQESCAFSHAHLKSVGNKKANIFLIFICVNLKFFLKKNNKICGCKYGFLFSYYSFMLCI